MLKSINLIKNIIFRSNTAEDQPDELNTESKIVENSQFYSKVESSVDDFEAFSDDEDTEQSGQQSNLNSTDPFKLLLSAVHYGQFDVAKQYLKQVQHVNAAEDSRTLERFFSNKELPQTLQDYFLDQKPDSNRLELEYDQYKKPFFLLVKTVVVKDNLEFLKELLDLWQESPNLSLDTNELEGIISSAGKLCFDAVMLVLEKAIEMATKKAIESGDNSLLGARLGVILKSHKKIQDFKSQYCKLIKEIIVQGNQDDDIKNIQAIQDQAIQNIETKYIDKGIDISVDYKERIKKVIEEAIKNGDLVQFESNLGKHLQLFKSTYLWWLESLQDTKNTQDAISDYINMIKVIFKPFQVEGNPGQASQEDIDKIRKIKDIAIAQFVTYDPNSSHSTTSKTNQSNSISQATSERFSKQLLSRFYSTQTGPTVAGSSNQSSQFQKKQCNENFLGSSVQR